MSVGIVNNAAGHATIVALGEGSGPGNAATYLFDTVSKVRQALPHTVWHTAMHELSFMWTVGPFYFIRIILIICCSVHHPPVGSKPN